MSDFTTYYSADDDPNVGFEPLDAGKYLCVIVASKIKPTRNNNGEYLELKLQVIEGAMKNRFLWDRLTLKHPNETTVRIARGMLAQIRNATGVMTPRDPVELHNLPLMVIVGKEKRADTGDITNVIKGYEKKGAAAAQTVTVASQDNSVPPYLR